MSRPIREVIEQLQADLACLDSAIHALEVLAGEKSRRGRPPKFMAEMKSRGRKGRPLKGRSRKRSK